MPPENKLLAWIEPLAGEFLAAFVAADVWRRPATRRYTSAAEALQWVEIEAAAIGASIEWVNRPQG